MTIPRSYSQDAAGRPAAADRETSVRFRQPLSILFQLPVREERNRCFSDLFRTAHFFAGRHETGSLKFTTGDLLLLRKNTDIFLSLSLFAA